MWTATTRAQRRRDGLRFAGDLTGAEWAVIEPLLPAPAQVGRPPAWPIRTIVNAIFYILVRGGIPWRMLPPCLPPRQTVYGWFTAWRDGGVWQTITHHLVMQDRERVGRDASPSAAVMDSQSVKITEAGGAGKKVLGRKRHAMVDIDGRPLVIQVRLTSVQDRDGAVPLLKDLRRRFPFIERVSADGAYTRPNGSPTPPASPWRSSASRQVRGLRGAPAPMGGRTLLRLARPDPPAGQGFRGNRHLRNRLPLRRPSHAAYQTDSSFRMSPESDSQTFQCLFFPLQSEDLVLLLRLPDVAEASDVSLVRDVRGWDG